MPNAGSPQPSSSSAATLRARVTAPSLGVSPCRTHVRPAQGTYPTRRAHNKEDRALEESLTDQSPRSKEEQALHTLWTLTFLCAGGVRR